MRLGLRAGRLNLLHGTKILTQIFHMPLILSQITILVRLTLLSSHPFSLMHIQGRTNSVPQPSAATGQMHKRETGTTQLSVVQGRRKLKTICATCGAFLTTYAIEIQFMFSKAPTSQLSLLSDLLPDAIQNSHQWKKERELGEPTTDCLTTMIPEDPDQDISISLWVGRKEGYQINQMIMLQRTWSAWHSH